jgi:putative transposase
MPYVKIWVHLVFGTKNHEQVLKDDISKQLYEHILQNTRAKNIFLAYIGGIDDRLHCLISLGAEQSIAKVTMLIKGESSHWINKEGIVRTKFEWADEYYAGSVGASQVDITAKYILNQREHHRRKTFTEEYDEFIKKYGFSKLG